MIFKIISAAGHISEIVLITYFFLQYFPKLLEMSGIPFLTWGLLAFGPACWTSPLSALEWADSTMGIGAWVPAWTGW